jgi:hypothetical protein
MWRKGLRHAHEKAPSALRKARIGKSRQLKKFHTRRNLSKQGAFWTLWGMKFGWETPLECSSEMQWDNTVSNEEKPNEKARAIRARQRAIGRELRRMYDDVAQEPVPDDFLDLLRKIDDAEDARTGKKVS